MHDLYNIFRIDYNDAVHCNISHMLDIIFHMSIFALLAQHANLGLLAQALRDAHWHKRLGIPLRVGARSPRLMIAREFAWA